MIQLKPQTENEKKRFEQGDKLNKVYDVQKSFTTDELD